MARYMTDGEICAMYREAADKKEQIKILAQLNEMDEEEIAEILRRNGFDVPAMRKRKRAFYVRRFRLSEEERERIVELRTQGYLIREIAEMMAINENTIVTTLHKRGISGRIKKEELKNG